MTSFADSPSARCSATGAPPRSLPSRMSVASGGRTLTSTSRVAGGAEATATGTGAVEGAGAGTGTGAAVAAGNAGADTASVCAVLLVVRAMTMTPMVPTMVPTAAMTA